jgi:hypothetical protein
MPVVVEVDSARRGAARLPVGRLTALFVLLSALPLALLAFFSVHLAADGLTREVKGRVSSNAARNAVAIQKEMQGLTELVQSYAQRPVLVHALADGNPAHYDRAVLRFNLEQLQAARPGIATTFLADPDGHLIDIVPATPSIVGGDSTVLGIVGLLGIVLAAGVLLLIRTLRARSVPTRNRSEAASRPSARAPRRSAPTAPRASSSLA